MTATTQRKLQIQFAEHVVQAGACLNEGEAAFRDARKALREATNILAVLGGQPGPDFVEVAA